MPIVEIKLIEGEFCEEDMKKLIADITDVLVSFLGENMRNYIWVMVQEMRNGTFGAGGQIVNLEDIRAIQACNPEKTE